MKEKSGVIDTLLKFEEGGQKSELKKPYVLERENHGTAIMLSLIENDDDNSFTYSYLLNSEYRKNSGITLFFNSATVFIKGRNLTPLYDNIKRHKVISIMKNDAKYDNVNEWETFIDSFEIKKS